MDGLISFFLVVTLLTALALLLFHLTIHPVWAIADCAVSKDQPSGAKVIWIIVMLLTWGLGSIVYGLFGTTSVLAKATRRTAGTLLGIIVVGIVAFTLIPQVTNRLPTRVRERLVTGRADPTTRTEIVSVAPDAVDLSPFKAIHYVPTSSSDFSVSIGQFDSKGLAREPVLPIAVPSIYPVNHLAIDPEGPVYYAATTHEVGKIIPSTGVFVPLELDPALPAVSWPAGIAFDSRNRMLIVSGRSNSYSYNPKTGEWKLLPAMAKVSLTGLAYDSESGRMFGLVDPIGNDDLEQLVELGTNGAVVRSINLAHAVPIGGVGRRGVQLLYSAGRLVILVSAQINPSGSGGGESTPAHMYVVDPANGDVVRLSGAA